MAGAKMARRSRQAPPLLLHLLLGFLLLVHVPSAAPQSFIGINYGDVADNLPPPSSTARLLKSTTIGKVRLYRTDPPSSPPSPARASPSCSAPPTATSPTSRPRRRPPRPGWPPTSRPHRPPLSTASPSATRCSSPTTPRWPRSWSRRCRTCMTRCRPTPASRSPP
ncbi:hypothetical protein ACQ4PT_069456 [Festuca glaucescens]